MSKPWLWMFVSAVIGMGAAWTVNFYRYGTESRFGPFGTDGAVTVSTAATDLESAEQATGNPKAFVVDGESSYDFGIMSPGDQGEHTFFIANTGQADLKLRLGASTCKCTIGALENESIAPGDKTGVKLSWQVKPDDVSFAQSAQILTNDPSEPALTFEITGKVVRDMDVVPLQWSFGEVAAGDSFEVAGTIYNFMDHDIEPTEPRFSDADMTELAEFSIEPFQPTRQADGIHSAARQGFRVVAKIESGLRQGALSRQLVFGFHKLDEQGNRMDATNDDKALEVLIPVSGSIVGPLGMILNDQLEERAGSYVYDLGRIGEDDPLTAKAFVVLKGKEHNNVKLRIGEVSPDQVIKAKLGEPKGSGPTRLFPLEIEMIPGTESVDRRGMSKDDYGWISIEADTPKVSTMRVLLKFSLDGR